MKAHDFQIISWQCTDVAFNSCSRSADFGVSSTVRYGINCIFLKHRCFLRKASARSCFETDDTNKDKKRVDLWQLLLFLCRLFRKPLHFLPLYLQLFATCEVLEHGQLVEDEKYNRCNCLSSCVLYECLTYASLVLIRSVYAI